MSSRRTDSENIRSCCGTRCGPPTRLRRDSSDPGLTERLVSGDLTMTMTQDGHRVTQHVSVALTLLLEGPPTLGQYGAVVIADTNAVRGES